MLDLKPSIQLFPLSQYVFPNRLRQIEEYAGHDSPVAVARNGKTVLQNLFHWEKSLQIKRPSEDSVEHLTIGVPCFDLLNYEFVPGAKQVTLC